MSSLGSISRVAAVSVALFAFASGTTIASDTGKKRFAIPAGDAALMLKQFADQSGRELIYSAKAVEGVRTNAVNGEFMSGDALKLMIAKTQLIAKEDMKSGALAIIYAPPTRAANPEQSKK